ncbi:SDR family oxidoreductase [Agromyces larvae]|uniref:SDR family oxidoreductase n=1 Tax=Agromyces larvae TaxID=2929802 RepID=A0ABY4BYT7_9MICO|nr:SDR family oxidoreductase [Agromyces larvae]UOE42851.1 SDR family oxidoreductase [Agromyces larvae]
MQRFEGRVALVTGGSRGIGFAIARRLVAEGASVVITGRKQDSLDAAVAELEAVLEAEQVAAGSGAGPRVSAIAGRADDPEHRAAAIAHAVATHGRLDHLVNNAGINPIWGPALDADPVVIRKILEVNLVAAFEWTRDAVRARAESSPGLRSIVNLSSISGVAAAPNIPFYGVSKAALINLTQQLAAELAPGVRVNAVAPAVVKTDFARALYEGREASVASEYPLARLGEPDDVAGPVAFLLSDDAAWITGQTLLIDGGASIRPIG